MRRCRFAPRATLAFRSSPVPDHADPGPVEPLLLGDIVDHERARLAHEVGLLPGAALDGADHAPVAGPLLSVGEMGHGVQVRGDELRRAKRVAWDVVLSMLETTTSERGDNERTRRRAKRVAKEKSFVTLSPFMLTFSALRRFAPRAPLSSFAPPLLTSQSSFSLIHSCAYWIL